MDNFQIETAQNVTISQNVAGIGERILAYLLDNLIIGIYILIIVFLISVTNIGTDSMFLILTTVGLPIFLYHLLWETLWNGQTPGKAVMKIRVVKLDGSKPSMSNYLLRWLLRLVDIGFTSGAVAVVTILLNGKGQRLGDIAATTTVISEKKNTGITTIRHIEIEEEYLPKYPQVTVFNDSEMQTIKKLFFEAKFNGNHNVILKLSAKSAEVMQVNFEEKPIEFLEKIIKDYAFYTQNI
jgi:uncharacterized RDD family membrane protein YckC